jgi:hypothetical protein
MIFIKMLATCYGGVTMSTSKVQTGLRLEPEALQKLTWLAKKQKRSLNAQLEFVAQQCIDEYESVHGAIPVEQEA